MSPAIGFNWEPAAENSALIASARKSIAATRHDRSSSMRVQARPTPLAAPVTMAVAMLTRRNP
jgi:hypothetical protein